MAKDKGLLSLIDSMVRVMKDGDPRITHDLENEFRMTVLEHPETDEELAEILPALVPKTPKEELRINTALDILSWLLEELRIDMERGRKGSRERMERLQESLARHVFKEGADPQLCAAVGRNLLESRVEIMPVIHEANRRIMFSIADDGEGHAPLEIAPLIVEAIGEMNVTDPHESLGIILDQIGLLEPACQIAIAGEMLASESALLRETAALMLFHPRQDVRSGVADILSRTKGESISPETLRRLIISRNWFPPQIRKTLDMTISNARRAKVECAPLKGNVIHSIFATTIDGAGAQSFWITAGAKKHVELCNILWKQGVGVIDTFIHRLPSAKAAERFIAGLPDMMCFAEVGQDFVDRAIGCAISIGVDRGGAPHRGLLQIAELLGTDRWKGEPLEADREIALLRGEALESGPAITAADAIAESAEWLGSQDFADAWFEDDDQVDRVVLNAMKGRGRNREARAVEDILAEVLEPRRGVWQERLLLMTLWFKSSLRPAIPWQNMFHLAEAVASGKPLRDIPLMRAVAEVTLDVATERSGRGK